jgi:two-component system chemotaxis response regulator CheB
MHPPSSDLRVLVVDDTALYRRLLTDAVAAIPRASVVGTARDGLGAIATLESTKVDFVVLDIEMPHLDGLETLAVLRRRWPDVGVVIVSGLDDRAAELTVEALSRGAIDFVPKGSGRTMAENQAHLASQLLRVVTSFRAKRLSSRAEREMPRTRPRNSPPPLGVASPMARPGAVLAPPIRPSPATGAIEAVAIATSTGGPRVLTEAIPLLPVTLPVPVFVVQHMPPVFTAALARSLTGKSALPVCEAYDGQPVLPGTVYVAPGGLHMVTRAPTAAGGAVRIGIVAPDPSDNNHPSADVLLRSLATTYGGRVLVAVMTGMGDDGASGVRALKHRGAYCLSQSEETCVVYGMPRAVAEAGLSDEVVDPAQLGPRIAALVAASRASS